MLGPLRMLLNREILRLAQLPRCLNVCAISVRGSAGTEAKFRDDVRRANEIFSCARVAIFASGFMEVDDPTLLRQTRWDVNTTPAEAMRLLAMGPACSRTASNLRPPNVFAYYVGTLGGGYNGIGRPNFANNAPGLVVSDAGGPYTFAHEIGHVLGLNPTVHDPDPNNIMYFDSPNITSDPPLITADQCMQARRSPIPVACPNIPELVAGPRPRLVRPLPFADTPALIGLLSDEPGVVERFAAMGAAILPQLLSRVNDPNLAIRERVLAVLARIGTPMALQAVERATMADPNPGVRALAATALAQAGRPLAMRAVTDINPSVRAAALRALAGRLALVGQS